MQMILRIYYILMLAVMLFVACDNGGRERALTEREKILEQREQRVTTIEDEYRSLQKMRDSLLASADELADSTHVNKLWPDSLQGEWNSRMICKSSGCSNYVIGDQRNEIWHFRSDSVRTYVEVTNNNRRLRVFEGKYDNQKIILTPSKDSTSTGTLQMRVELDNVMRRLIQGTQVITGKDNCQAVFSVELTRR